MVRILINQRNSIMMMASGKHCREKRVKMGKYDKGVLLDSCVAKLLVVRILKIAISLTHSTTQNHQTIMSLGEFI